MLFYKCIRPILLTILKSLWKIEVVNASLIPEDGSALLVGNHSSWIDTLIISCTTKRPVWFATGDFILDVPVMNNLVRHLCIIPMTKNNGKQGIQGIVEKLQTNNLACIFPEGALTTTGELMRFRNGVSIIQKEANVKIIPFYIKGGYDAWSIKQKYPLFFKKIQITFGEAFYPQAEKDNEIAQEIKSKVESLISA